MAITDNMRLTLKVCRLYYEKNLSQKEISAQLDISRPQISRMLASARSSNLVSIAINDPFVKETNLERILIERYGLKDALVIDTGVIGENRSSADELGLLAAPYMDAYIKDYNRVGVMSGQTISSLVWSINHLEKKGLEFVPLVGGIGYTSASWHANAIAQRFAESTKGSCYILNAPVLVQNRQVRDILVAEPGIASVLEKGLHCDVAIVGIGQIHCDSTTVKAGALDGGDINRLKEAGAVASICTTYLDAQGKVIEMEINQRSIGIRLEQLKKARTIGIASGQNKVASIKAALASGYLDVFITNLETARFIAE